MGGTYRRTADTQPRKGCKDIWNAYMVKGAVFSCNDIPFCPTTAEALPEKLITWREAKYIYKHAPKSEKNRSLYNAFVCFYEDDQYFDGVNGIWHNPQHARKVLKCFAGAVTPDFSTYQDFPEPIKIYHTYCMRALGRWWGKNGIPVYNNVRWGTPETYRYCFDGIPRNDTVVIGTVGGSPRKLIDRERFETGLTEMVKRISPHTILVYGSANYSCFARLKDQGIKVIDYRSKTDQAYKSLKESLTGGKYGESLRNVLQRDRHDAESRDMHRGRTGKKSGCQRGRAV